MCMKLYVKEFFFIDDGCIQFVVIVVGKVGVGQLMM